MRHSHDSSHSRLLTTEKMLPNGWIVGMTTGDFYRSLPKLAIGSVETQKIQVFNGKSGDDDADVVMNEPPGE